MRRFAFLLPVLLVGFAGSLVDVTPAASTINLPTAVQTAGWRQCIKDGTTNNATVKSPTSGTIAMNQAKEERCVYGDGKRHVE